MISTIFIANRSEIAQRITRTAHEMNIRAVVGYADPDINATYVSLADEAYALGGSSYNDTYMDGAKLLDIALRANADAVHPGYGFLSENAEFAQSVIDAGLTWIGPLPSVLNDLGDKIQARALALRTNVQPVPGISDGEINADRIHEFVAKWGFPIVTKKSDGGGGRGITIIRNETDLKHFFAAHGNDLKNVFVEKFLENARHVETQSARDGFGNFAVVSTRDCSIQRRNQKLIEEAAAPNLTEAQEAEIRRASQALFEAVDYVGVGTCEFLVDGDSGHVFFLEVNPRLQVEHTVSEEVTGIDLVAEQIRIASGEKLSEIPETTGHSFEFRITCEDPQADMVPSQGTITELHWPLGQGIRIESGIAVGDHITGAFDSMMAKIVVTGPDRETALARSKRALNEFRLRGIAHPTQLYLDIISHPDFAALNYTTRWLEEKFLPEWQKKYPPLPAADTASTPSAPNAAKPADTATSHTFTIEINGKRAQITLPPEMLAATASAPAGHTPRPQPLRRNRKVSQATADTQTAVDGDVVSPIQAIVIRVCVNEGDDVAEGDLLIVLESMKMESYVYAPVSGTITKIHVSDGSNVAAGAPLLKIETAQD